MYFNYHAKIKKLIVEGHLTRYEFVPEWRGISPALVLYFDNGRPMPVRQYRWAEYKELLSGEREWTAREFSRYGIDPAA